MHVREYYLTLKRKEIFAPAAAWIDLKDVMLSEVSQA